MNKIINIQICLAPSPPGSTCLKCTAKQILGGITYFPFLLPKNVSLFLRYDIVNLKYYLF